MDATCTIQDSIHVFNLVHKYVSRILGTYQLSAIGDSTGKLKIPPTYHRKPVKQSNKNLYAIPQKSL